jgi:hypothetical protein
MDVFLRNGFVSEVNNNTTMYDVFELMIMLFYLNVVSLSMLSLLGIYMAIRFEDSELERVWEEVVVAYFKVISLHFLRGAWEY